MYIYKITNKINNKSYIGQTICKYASQRWQSHKYDAKNSKKDHPLHRSINKYGIENFTFEVIYKSKTLKDLNEKEIYFIDFYKTTTIEHGYNILAGGKNSKHTEETKRKIGLKSIGRKTFLGKKHSQETKIKISIATKNRIPYNKNTRMSQEDKIKHRNIQIERLKIKKFIDQNNNIYCSIREASKKLNIHRNLISNVLNKKQKSTKGYFFSYLEQTLPTNPAEMLPQG